MYFRSSKFVIQDLVKPDGGQDNVAAAAIRGERSPCFRSSKIL
jgi:hypothetical protein